MPHILMKALNKVKNGQESQVSAPPLKAIIQPGLLRELNFRDTIRNNIQSGNAYLETTSNTIETSSRGKFNLYSIILNFKLLLFM